MPATTPRMNPSAPNRNDRAVPAAPAFQRVRRSVQAGSGADGTIRFAQPLAAPMQEAEHPAPDFGEGEYAPSKDEIVGTWRTVERLLTQPGWTAHHKNVARFKAEREKAAKEKRPFQLERPKPPYQVPDPALIRDENGGRLGAVVRARTAAALTKNGPRPLVDLSPEMAQSAAEQAVGPFLKVAKLRRQEDVDVFLATNNGETAILETALLLEMQGVTVAHEASRTIVKNYITTKIKFAS